MRGREVRVERADGSTVCERCRVAENPLTRLKGLLGRREIPSGEGLLLRPVGAIHTWFMRFPIDAVFLDRELSVVGVVADLKPWRVAGRRGARSVLELPAGECARLALRPQERLRLG
jgi:uncharacterized membrane protein (UPF0127 family)